MVEPTPLQAFADLLYQYESELARRSSQMDQFLRSASLDGAVARALIDREAETEPYARFHASRFLDLLRALSAVCDGLGTGSVDVLDCGIGPVTRLYRKVIARATLRTTSLPRPFSAAETAKKFDSSDHRYIDLDFEPISERMPDWRAQFDVVIFAEVIEHVRATPAEQIGDLLALLRPGGYLITSTPNALSRAYVARLFTGRLISTVYQRDKMRTGQAHSFHVREYTPTELREAIVAAGAEPVQEGLFDWYGSAGDPEIQHVSGRDSMMAIIRKPS